MAGFSAHLLSDGSQLYLGAPGAEYFKGSPIKGFTTSRCQSGFAKNSRESFDYLGYSITSGRIFDRNSDAIVVSSPRYGNGVKLTVMRFLHITITYLHKLVAFSMLLNGVRTNI